MTGSLSPLLDGLPERISHVVQPWAERCPDRPAVADEAGAWSYGQLADVIARTRAWLIRHGVRPGDRVMIVGENCRAYVALLLATADMDAWAVILNARATGPEIDHVRDHCDARLVLYTVAASVHAAGHCTRHGARMVAAPVAGIAAGLLNQAAVCEPVQADGARQVAVLIYTSGTTGQPRGVMLTHRNILFIASMSGRLRSVARGDRFLGVLPLSFSVCLSVGLIGMLLAGATIQLLNRFDPHAVLNALRNDNVTLMLGVPSMFRLLIEHAGRHGLRAIACPALRVISASGAPLDMELKAAAGRWFGQTLHHGYGITECSPTIAQTRLEQPRDDLSVGPLLPLVEAKLVSPEGDPAPDGEPGELHVRGPNIMHGYYNAPDDTRRAIDPQGWFNTGDLARLQDGDLFIVGRSKELILRLGFNVYPPEVEAALNAHPDVTQSAVVGRPADGTEEIVAFVQPRPGSLVTARQLADHVAKMLAAYKRPSEIVLMAQLPAGSTGKVLKAALAAQAAGMGQAGRAARPTCPASRL